MTAHVDSFRLKAISNYIMTLWKGFELYEEGCRLAVRHQCEAIIQLPKTNLQNPDKGFKNWS